VAAHPLLVLVVAGAPMAMLAGQVRRISTGLPRSGWLPPSMESARALADLEAMDRAGVVQALRVVVELPRGASAFEGDGWRAVARLGHVLAADPRVERVQSLPLLTGADEPSLMLAAMLPPDVARSFVSRDQRLAVLEVLPRSNVDFPSLTAFVREIRGRDVQATTGARGVHVLVGGMPAFNADYEDAITGALPLVVALVLGGTLLALLLGFRSVAIPIKALVLNALSVAAALGAVVLVFQDGHGVRVVGLTSGMGSLFPALPVLVFCIVFGLSMDYEVFLVARVAEARRGGASEEEAIAEGLARTGGVITSAAAIMIVVFAAFMLGDFLMTKVLGFALAAAVLFDATIVRMAIGPALLRLAGRWNWWPGERRTDESVWVAGSLACPRDAGRTTYDPGGD
jgi:RND superfamily putative drug exporter